jgi:4,4-dimethyl-9beta,19-cyclopropylsterol-4alpha-methyl oxidase
MLPYQTLEEAAAAVGRNLTYAETLWFNYSADKSDYFLYCHNTILLFFIYSVVPLPMVFLELARVDRYKIQPKARMSVPEIFRSYRDTMLVFFLIEGPLQLMSFSSVKVLCFWVGFLGFWCFCW